MLPGNLNFPKIYVIVDAILQNPKGVAKAMGRQRSQHLLISTKINRPVVREKWGKRTRPICLPSEGQEQRVTLISAPAGYGKTTLVVQWLDVVTGHAASLSLEKNDSDPNRFLRYVIASIRTVFPEFDPRFRYAVLHKSEGQERYIHDFRIILNYDFSLL